MLNQTKRIRGALLRAGFSSDEIRVRTPYRAGYGYQSVNILILANRQKQIDLIQSVINTGHIDIILLQFEGEPSPYEHFPAYYEGTGKLTIQKISRNQ